MLSSLLKIMIIFFQISHQALNSRGLSEDHQEDELKDTVGLACISKETAISCQKLSHSIDSIAISLTRSSWLPSLLSLPS